MTSCAWGPPVDAWDPAVDAPEPAADGRAVCATVRVRLAVADRGTGFEEWLAGQFDVVEISRCQGHFDYELRLACRDADTLHGVVSAIRHAGGAVATETTLVIDRVRSSWRSASRSS